MLNDYCFSNNYLLNYWVGDCFTHSRNVSELRQPSSLFSFMTYCCERWPNEEGFCGIWNNFSQWMQPIAGFLHLMRQPIQAGSQRRFQRNVSYRNQTPSEIACRRFCSYASSKCVKWIINRPLMEIGEIANTAKRFENWLKWNCVVSINSKHVRISDFHLRCIYEEITETEIHKINMLISIEIVC